MRRPYSLVYECQTCGEEERMLAQDVAAPEAHVGGTERVYCSNDPDEMNSIGGGMDFKDDGCGEDREMRFKGVVHPGEDLDGVGVCPLCMGPCEHRGVTAGDVDDWTGTMAFDYSEFGNWPPQW